MTARTPRTRRHALEPFPAVATAAWLVGIFAVSTAPIEDLWRPLITATLLALVLTACAAVASGGRKSAQLIVGCAWLLALGATPVVGLVALVIAWRLLINGLRRIRGAPAVRESLWRQVTRVANAIAAALAIVSALWMANSGALAFEAASAASGDAINGVPDDAPSIYMVLLDGYPRADTLLEEFSFSNDEFLAALRQRGFSVAEASRSNYNSTLLTLASMFHMGYVDDIEALSEVSATPAGQTRQLTAALSRGSAFELLEGADYRTVSIRTIYGEAALRGLDETRDIGVLTRFEEQVLRFTPLGHWILSIDSSFVANQHRRGVVRNMEELANTAEPHRQFVFAHTFSPHPPIVFRSDGSPRDLPGCYPAKCSLPVTEAKAIGMTQEEFGAALTGQIEYLNKLVLTATDEIIREDPTAVVVLFSDHGARHQGGMQEEHFRTFFAARTPGRDHVFPEDVSPVNVVPILANSYLGANLTVHPYRSWWAPPETPLRLIPVLHGAAAPAWTPSMSRFRLGWSEEGGTSPRPRGRFAR